MINEENNYISSGLSLKEMREQILAKNLNEKSQIYINDNEKQTVISLKDESGKGIIVYKDGILKHSTRLLGTAIKDNSIFLEKLFFDKAAPSPLSNDQYFICGGCTSVGSIDWTNHIQIGIVDGKFDFKKLNLNCFDKSLMNEFTFTREKNDSGFCFNPQLSITKIEKKIGNIAENVELNDHQLIITLYGTDIKKN